MLFLEQTVGVTVSVNGVCVCDNALDTNLGLLATAVRVILPSQSVSLLWLVVAAENVLPR